MKFSLMKVGLMAAIVGVLTLTGCGHAPRHAKHGHGPKHGPPPAPASQVVIAPIGSMQTWDVVTGVGDKTGVFTNAFTKGNIAVQHQAPINASGIVVMEPQQAPGKPFFPDIWAAYRPIKPPTGLIAPIPGVATNQP